MRVSVTSYYDSAGGSINLGKRIASGGEGEIYELESPNFVAKIYKAEISPGKEQKLKVMVAHCDEELRKISAWPTKLLFNSKGSVCGFIMDRIVDYKPFYELCNPSARKKFFPDKDYLFLLFCVRNIIVAFRVIHTKKIIVGDVNESNLVVSDKGLIKFIDCDSFQIIHQNQHYACEVGVPLYTPPELHSTLLAAVKRTENHDFFGLAVLCFQLLFMGRHPYVGIYAGPEIPFEKEIQLFRFAYGKIGREKGIKAPEGTLSFESIPQGLQLLFEQSFSERGVVGRPNLTMWFNEVDNLIKHLSVCNRDAGHKYYSALKACPWCFLEDKKGLFFFIKSKVFTVGFDTFNLSKIWTEIQNINVPSKDLSFNARSFSLQPNHGKSDIKALAFLAKLQKVFACIIPIIAMFISGVAFLISIPIAIFVYNVSLSQGRIERERVKHRDSLNEKNNSYQYQLKRWNDEASPAKLNKLKGDLETIVKKYQRLPNDYALEKQRLYNEREFHQLQIFLGKYYLRNFSIPHIKEARKITLRSFGVETAADILKNINVPGFGPFLTGELFAWRKSLEKKFNFNPALDIDSEHLNNLNQKFANLKRDYEKQLLGGVEELRQLRSRILNAQNTLQVSVTQAAKDFYQEEVNFKNLFG